VTALSLVIPAYNEERRLPRLLDALSSTWWRTSPARASS
jgi:glycosyltransferase involved in cell wall biosynthesis